jgi:hypothetical protein
MPKTTPEQNKAVVLEAFDTLFNKRDYAAGRWWVKDKNGKSVLKPPGWSPDTQKKIVEGAAAVGVGAAMGYGVNFIINTAPEWLPFVVAAF